MRSHTCASTMIVAKNLEEIAISVGIILHTPLKTHNNSQAKLFEIKLCRLSN